ncbi:hypothetical protein CMV_016756 [Castanea mollissima]|nr:hypothetical protein CMV_016756 [Castanea mollissima]
MEVLALRSSITQAKIMGTIVSISGALIVVFYKDPAIMSAQVMKIYPAEFIQALFFMCATIVSTPVCIIAKWNLSAFRRRPDIALAAIIYSDTWTTKG